MDQSGGYRIQFRYTTFADFGAYLRHQVQTTGGLILIPGQKRGICATDTVITSLWYADGLRELFWASFVFNHGGVVDTRDIEHWKPGQGKPLPTYADYLRLIAHRLIAMYQTENIVTATPPTVTRSQTNRPEGAPIDLGEECANFTGLLTRRSGYIREPKDQWGAQAAEFGLLVEGILKTIAFLHGGPSIVSATWGRNPPSSPMYPVAILCSGQHFYRTDPSKGVGRHAISFIRVDGTWCYADDNWGFAMPLFTKTDRVRITFEQLTETNSTFVLRVGRVVPGDTSSDMMLYPLLIKTSGESIEMNPIGPFRRRGVAEYEFRIDTPFMVLGCREGILPYANTQLSGTLIEDALEFSGTGTIDDAVRGGDARSVRYFLAMGANANGMSTAGLPLIVRAIENGNLDVLRTLIQGGANVNRDMFGVSPLISAVATANLEVFQLLLASGADPSGLSHGGMTPLQYIDSQLAKAAQDKRRALLAIRQVVQDRLGLAGASGAAAASSAPAAPGGWEAVVRNMVLPPAAPAAPAAPSPQDIRDFFRSIEFQDVDTRQNFLKRFPVLLNTPNPNDKRKTPLMRAIETDIDAAIQFLTQGADVTPVDTDGNTALHYAARKSGAYSIIPTLFEHGAKSVVYNAAYETPYDVVYDTSALRVLFPKLPQGWHVAYGRQFPDTKGGHFRLLEPIPGQIGVYIMPRSGVRVAVYPDENGQFSIYTRLTPNSRDLEDIDVRLEVRGISSNRRGGKRRKTFRRRRSSLPTPKGPSSGRRSRYTRRRRGLRS